LKTLYISLHSVPEHSWMSRKSGGTYEEGAMSLSRAPFSLLWSIPTGTEKGSSERDHVPPSPRDREHIVLDDAQAVDQKVAHLRGAAT
jgi:hypothetical protein